MHNAVNPNLESKPNPQLRNPDIGAFIQTLIASTQKMSDSEARAANIGGPHPTHAFSRSIALIIAHSFTSADSAAQTISGLGILL